MLNTIHHIPCEIGRAQMPDESVDLFVTSPPYGGLRQYNGFSMQTLNVTSLLPKRDVRGVRGLAVKPHCQQCI